jgi:signal-transduction protein with cAMP-binding, CBS, and nucleotidyltransferase domain
VVGIVTDRDVCMATYTTGRAPQSIRVADAMSDQVFCCQAEDSLEAAEILMREKQIRRLPVVDDQSRPVGVLSLNDVARVAEERRREPIDREVIRTIAEIGRGRPTGQLAARR